MMPCLLVDWGGASCSETETNKQTSTNSEMKLSNVGQQHIVTSSSGKAIGGIGEGLNPHLPSGPHFGFYRPTPIYTQLTATSKLLIAVKCIKIYRSEVIILKNFLGWEGKALRQPY